MQSGHRHYNTLWCAGQNFITMFLNGPLDVGQRGLLTPRLIRLFTSTRITPMQTGSGVLRTLTLRPRLLIDGEQLPRAHFSRGATVPAQLI